MLSKDEARRANIPGWLGQAPEISESDIAWERSADIVVVGAGHAGIQAALAAAESGASVLVVEAQHENAYRVYGEDIGVWNSRWQIEKGFGPYRLGDVVHEFVRRGGGRLNPELIRQYVHESGEMFDHMIELVNREGDFDTLFHWGNGEDGELIVQVQKGVDQYPIESGGYRTWASAIQFVGTISHETTAGCASRSQLQRFQNYAIRESQRLGAQWLFHTEAVVLTQGAAGNVDGVIVRDSVTKALIRLRAGKAVLVSTGDFAGNAEMCTQLLAEAAEWGALYGKETVRGTNGRRGDGHKLCCWAGGQIEPPPRAVMNLGGGPFAPWGMSPMLWLNQYGKRFCNEAAQAVTMGAVARQPRGLIAAITDANFMKSVQAAGVEHGAPNYGRPVYYDELEHDMKMAASSGENPHSVRGASVIERKGEPVYTADTLPELLRFIGYTEDQISTAIRQISHYNQLCHAGEDIDFGKDTAAMIPVETPPFYAVVKQNDGQQKIGLVTLAGMMTDDKMNVLRADGTPISGLYVAGNTLGGRYGIGYSTPTAGNSIGMAMTHGRIVGKTMARL